MTNDAALERITILLQAKDRDMARALDRSNKLMAKFARDAERQSGMMSRKVTADLNKAGEAAMGMGRTFVAGIAGGAVATLFSSLNTNVGGVVKSIAQIGDEARRSGLGLAEFQQWKFVADQNRIGVDQLVDGFKELALRSDEFIATGGGPAAEALGRLGYSSAELAAKLKDPSDLMLEMLGRMQGLDKAAQIRIADELFGGSGGERFVELLDQGADSIDRTIDRAYDLGLVLDDEVIAKAAELDRKFGAVAATLDTMLKRIVVAAAANAGLLTDVDKIFGSSDAARGQLGDDVYDAIKRNSEAAEAAQPALEALRYSYEDLGETVAFAATQIGNEVAGLIDVGALDQALQLADIASEMENLVAQVSSGSIPAEEFQGKLSDLITRAGSAFVAANDIDGVDMSNAIGAVDRLSTAMSTLFAYARAAGDEVRGVAGLKVAASGGRGDGAAEAARRRLEGPGSWQPDAGAPGVRPPRAPTELGFDLVKTGNGKGAGGKGGRSRGLSEEIERTRERIVELQAEAAVLLTVVAGNRDLGDAMEYARKKADLLSAAQAEGREITPALAAEIDDLALAYMAAGLEAEQAADRIDRIKEASERGMDTLADLFDDVILRGGSAKRVVAGLLLEIAKVQFRNFLTGLSGGGGFFGFLGGLLTPKRAYGGPAAAGVPYLVNEQTPNSEMFVPSRSGGVLNVPQAQAALRDAAGGQRGGATSITVYADESVIVRAADGVVVRRIAQAGPAIVDQAVNQVWDRAAQVPLP